MTPPAAQLLRVFAGSAFAIAIAGAVAWSTGQPWLFPSLGPTVMLQAPTGVHEIWIRSTWNYDPAELKAEHRISTALDAIAQGSPTEASVTAERRYVLAGLWALAALTCLGIIATLLILGLLNRR